MKLFRQGILSVTKRVLESNKFRSEYFSNVLWSFAEKIVKFLAEVLVGFYLARTIGVSAFGVYNYAISISVLFQGISTLGLSDLLTRELVNNRNQERKILSTALTVRLIASALFVTVINLMSANEPTAVRQTIFAISLSLVFRSIEVLIYFFHSIIRSELVSKTQIFISSLTSLVKVYLLAISAPIQAFAWIYSIEWMLISVGLMLLFFRHRPGIKFSFSLRFLRRLMLHSWPLLAASVAINLYMRMDQIMIRTLISDQENGYYSAAVRLTEIWYIFPMILGSIFFPALLNAKKQEQNLYRERLLMLNSFLFWVAFLLALVISPFSEFIITTLYDQTYADAAPILAIHIWSGIFTFLGVAGTYWLMAENLQVFSLVRTLMALIVNLALNFLLIPRLGAIGAAVGSLCTQAVASVLALLVWKKTRRLVLIQIHSIIYPITWMKKLHY